MITQPEIIAQLQALPEAGVFTEDSRYDMNFMEDIVNQARATVAMDFYKKYGRINPIFTQQYFPEFVATMQEATCFVQFAMPSFISLDNETDGMFYLGSKEGNCNFRKAANRADLASRNQHRYLKNLIRPRYIFSDGNVEIYSSTILKECRADAIFTTPSDIPTWNKLTDNYPFDMALMPQLKDVIFNELGKELQQPAVIKNQSESK